MTDRTVVFSVVDGRGFQWVARILMLIALLVPRWLAYSSAGGLWRDEVHSVDMANLPQQELFFALTHDSFPILWAVLLRSWIAVFGGGDASLRAMGFLIGIGVIPAMWWALRQFGVRFPWWTMVFVGLDPSLIVFGGEVRGYGLGVVTLLILIGMSWRIVKQPTPLGWFCLFFAALAAVQSSYTNCFLLAATFIASGIVTLSRRRYGVCVGFGVIGILAAASMVPYVLYVFPRLSGAIKPFFGLVGWFTPIQVFLVAYITGGVVRAVLWVLVGMIGFVEILHRLGFWPANTPLQTNLEQDLALFLPPFVWIGTGGFWFYMYFMSVPTHWWYYLPWLTHLAVTTDICMDLWSRQPHRQRWPIVGSVMLVGVLVLCETLPTVRYRLTTMDLIADELNHSVQKGDLVIVLPWYYGMSFQRYYHGPAECMNLPDVDRDHRHRGYEELKSRVMPLPTAVGIQKELEKIEAVLRSSRKVWWISPYDPLSEGEQPLTLGGAPDPMHGWNEFVFTTSWNEVAIARMYELGATKREWLDRKKGLVNPNENPVVYVFEQSHEIPAAQ